MDAKIRPDHAASLHGDAITTVGTTLNLDAVQALLLQVGKRPGLAGTSGYTLAVTLNVHVPATVAGRRWSRTSRPALNFSLEPLQLQVGSGGASSAKKGSVATASVIANPMHVLGRTMSASTLADRGSRLLGFVICGLSSIPLAVLLRRNRAFDEAARIRARYGHLLVPILIGEDLGWPPVDVTDFKALVRLAEAAGQVILHHQADAVDTYLVNDNGTVYRYQITLPVVSWGEWTETNLAADPAALAHAATALADVAVAALRSRPREARRPARRVTIQA